MIGQLGLFASQPAPQVEQQGDLGGWVRGDGPLVQGVIARRVIGKPRHARVVTRDQPYGIGSQLGSDDWVDISEEEANV